MAASSSLPLLKRLLYAASDPLLYVRGRSIDLPASHPASDARTDRAALRMSIVTPSFNQGEFLARTIASVVNQRYSPLEYVVQDGGSNDGSVSILEHHSHELTYWESRPDGGQSAAINAGFRRTTGDIMMYLNSDDILFPGALQYVSTFFVTHPDVDVVYSHSVMIDPSDRQVALVLLPGHSSRALRWHNFVPQPTCAWRRSVWEAAGSHLEESMHYSMDWDLLHRFMDVGARFARLPTFLAAFRVHPSQKSELTRHRGSPDHAAIQRRFVKREVSFAEAAVRWSPHVLRRALLASAFRLGLYRIEFPCVLDRHGAATSA